MLRKFILLAPLIFFVGCTTLTKEQCQGIDYYADGYSAGFWRHSADFKIDSYKKNCEKDHGIAPDLAAFKKGYANGALALCTKDGGYKFGEGGGMYDKSCGARKTSFSPDTLEVKPSTRATESTVSRMRSSVFATASPKKILRSAGSAAKSVIFSQRLIVRNRFRDLRVYSQESWPGPRPGRERSEALPNIESLHS